MKFFDLVNISERYMEIVNPTSHEKLLTVGEILGLGQNNRIIDFGCGYGEVLVLWAERYGIFGIGIDVREHACERARSKINQRGMADRIEIVCADAAKYNLENHGFDVALCIGTSFIWGGYRQAIQAMKKAVYAGGKLIIGEPYWLTDYVPPEYGHGEETVHSEFELLQITREEGFDIEYIVRASHDDWDRYETGNWYGLIRWIEENPNHPERKDVIAHLHKSQEEYVKYGRQYVGWAMYVLNPMRT